MNMPRNNYKSYKYITLLARNLRKNQTPSEKLLWEKLRRKRFSGFKFLRQHPVFYHIGSGRIEFYIPDFYCSKLKLVIEVDGPIHDFHEEYDNERDTKLLKKEIRVIRFRNEELANLDGIIKRVEEIVAQREIQITDSESD